MEPPAIRGQAGNGKGEGNGAQTSRGPASMMRSAARSCPRGRTGALWRSHNSELHAKHVQWLIARFSTGKPSRNSSIDSLVASGKNTPVCTHLASACIRRARRSGYAPLRAPPSTGSGPSLDTRLAPLLGMRGETGVQGASASKVCNIVPLPIAIFVHKTVLQMNTIPKRGCYTHHKRCFTCKSWKIEGVGRPAGKEAKPAEAAKTPPGPAGHHANGPDSGLPSPLAGLAYAHISRRPASGAPGGPATSRSPRLRRQAQDRPSIRGWTAGVRQDIYHCHISSWSFR